MSVYSIANNVVENMKVKEATSMSNIAYVAGGFGTVKTALKILSQMKDDWGVEVLEGEEETYNVKIEDSLIISVPKDLWEEFAIEMFGNKINVKNMNLAKYLEESIVDCNKDLLRKVKASVKKLYKQKPYSIMERNIKIWRALFGATRFITTPKTCIPVESKIKSSKYLCKTIESAYGKDRGMLEMLLSALSKGKSLIDFDVFENYDKITGTVIYIRKDNTVFTYESSIDLNGKLTETIRVTDKDVLESLKESRFGRRNKNIVSPKGDFFTNKEFKNFKAIIQDVNDETNNRS